MAEIGSPYKKVSLEEATPDTQLREDLSSLDKPWQSERARFKMASRLAYGLLGLFALTIACSGTVITTLVVTYAIPGTGGGHPADAIAQMLQFVTTLIPYIAMPLGVALGYFFREPRSE